MSTTGGEAVDEAELQRLRDAYLASLETLGDAANGVHRALNESAAALIVVRNHVRNGGMVSDFENLIDPGQVRAGLSGALDALERKRHQSQRLLFRLLQAEGRTPAHIARVFKLSRQLVSRMVNEADPDDA